MLDAIFLLTVKLVIKNVIVTLIVLGALIVAPFTPSARACKMSDQLSHKAMTCHGCCAKMKCCEVSREGKPQPAAPVSTGSTSHPLTAAIAQTTFAVLYLLPVTSDEIIPSTANRVAHSPAPLALFCIRLI